MRGYAEGVRPSLGWQPAGNFAGGICVFTVIYREREKVLSFLGHFRGASGNQDDRVSVAHERGAVRLLRDFSHFYCKFKSADVGRNSISHDSSIFFRLHGEMQGGTYELGIMIYES